MENNQKYVEIAEGYVGNRSIIIPSNEIAQRLEPKKELYISYYEYDDEIIEHLKVYKTVSSYKGNKYFSNNAPILFDIDKGNLTEKALLESVRNFVKELKEDWELNNDEIVIWFSGRGFHIQTSDFLGFEEGKALADVMKNTLPKLFELPDPIYTNNRLIRCPYSYNSKSGYYKIPLSHSELYQLDMDSIKEIAINPPTNSRDVNTKVSRYANKIHEDLIVDVKEKENTPIKISDNPNSVVTCVQKMYNEGPTKGSRHNLMMRMTSAWRRHGVPKGAIYYALTNWVPDLEPYDIKRMVENVFEKNYRYGCNDRFMDKYCDSKCVFYKNKNFQPEIKNATEMEKDFAEYIRNDYASKSFDMRSIYKSATSNWKVVPGDLVIIYGNTGVGKSSFTQNLVYKSGLNTLFLSLEVTAHLTFRRFIQMAHSMTKDEVLKHYKKHDDSLHKAIDKIRVMSVAPTLESIEMIVASEMPKPEILVIDTTDELVVPFVNSEIDKQNKIANSLKTLAQKQGIIIIAVHHLSKEASKNPTQLTVHSGKGSSSIPQKADKVMAVLGYDNAPERVIQSMKSRDESNFSLPMMFDYKTYTFKERLPNGK